MPEFLMFTVGATQHREDSQPSPINAHYGKPARNVLDSGVFGPPLKNPRFSRGNLMVQIS
jgi:hypothetical protein